MRQIRRTFIAVLVLLAAVVIVPAFGGSVSAHHANITASVACDGTVSWTASSWATGAAGTNPDIRVTKRVGSTTTPVQKGAFNNANNYQFSGTFAWPAGATSVTVTSKPYAKWGNGTTSNTGSSVTVKKPNHCAGQAGVSKAVSCVNPSTGHGDGQVVLILSNDTGLFASAVVFKVFHPDQVVTFTEYTVAPGGSSSVIFTPLADGVHSVKISAGSSSHDQEFTVDCDSPIAAVSSASSCVNGDGDVVVTLVNNGGEGVTFAVTDPKTSIVENVVVGADVTNVTRSFGGLADGTYTVVIMVGSANHSQTFTVACDRPGTGTISTLASCVDADGQVVISLIATGGLLPVIFTVRGVVYSVVPNTTLLVTISGLGDGPALIPVSANGVDLSFTTTTDCDLAPTSSYAQACVDFDDTVTVLIGNPGDDLDVVFTINGVDYVLHPGDSLPVVIGPLPDGINNITLAIDGTPQYDITVQSDCDPTFSAVAVCNSADGNGGVTNYWFNITNTESTPITVTWKGGGSATVPAGQTIAVSSPTAPLVLMHNLASIAEAPATETKCERTVVVKKTLDGAPATGETYTVRVSRLVGATYQTELTFDINADESKTITLPSTLDPAGITYTIDEINAGTASTSAVAPNALTLAGHLGETVNVVVTNGYASVQIDKTTSNAIVVPGGQISYTLQGTNTGALMLNPVVIADRLPPMVSLASATVATGGAAGECHLVETTRPQLLSCTLADALAPGEFTALITIVVDVDTTAAGGGTIVNQAMIHGAFEVGAVITQSGTSGPQLTCNPVIAGTVCDLSSQVGVPVAQGQVLSLPPVPPAPVADVVAQLPRTGADHVRQMLALAFGGVLLGGAMLIARRRIGAR